MNKRNSLIKKRTLVSVLATILSVSSIYGQIQMVKNGSIITTETEIPKNELSDFSVKIPFEDIKNYDKIILAIYYDLSQMNMIQKKLYEDQLMANENDLRLPYFPKDPGFESKYIKNGYLEMNLIHSKTEKGFCEKKDVDAPNLKFKLFIDGYMQDGIESYWSEFHKSHRTKKLYKYSNKISETPMIKVFKLKKKG